MDRASYVAKHAKAYALKQGPYVAFSHADVRADEMVFVSQGHSAITRATSKYPVIGTDSTDNCLGMIIYEPIRKVAGCFHNAEYSVKDFDALLHAVRGDSERSVKIYLFGANTSLYEASPFNRPAFDFDGIRDDLNGILSRIETTPGCKLVACDLDEKPHPSGAYLDTRNGRLIRTGNDSAVEIDPDNGEIMTFSDHDSAIPRHATTPDTGWDRAHFDYSTPDYQLKSYKQRRPVPLREQG